MCEQLHGKAAVVSVPVIGDRQTITRVRRRRVAELIARTAGPVQPRRPIVGAGEGDRGVLEQLRRYGELALAVRPPASLPGRPLRVAMLGKPLQQLAEHAIRRGVLVDDDVMRREVVQRFRRPLALRKVRDQLTREGHVARLIAERAYGGQIEETRFRFAPAAFDVPLQRVACRPMPIQVIVGFRQAQRDQLALVALRGARERLEGGARLRPPPRGEQLFRAGQLTGEPIGRHQGRRLETLEPLLRVGRFRAQRKVVVDAAVRLQRVLGVPRCFLGASEREKDLFRITDLVVAEAFEKVFGAIRVVARDRDVPKQQRRAFSQVALGLARKQRGERRIGLVKARQPFERHGSVVVRVRLERRARQISRADQWQPGGEIS